MHLNLSQHRNIFQGNSAVQLLWGHGHQRGILREFPHHSFTDGQTQPPSLPKRLQPPHSDKTLTFGYLTLQCSPSTLLINSPYFMQDRIQFPPSFPPPCYCATKTHRKEEAEEVANW